MANSDIYVAKESAMAFLDGVPTVLSKGVTRVRAGHELLKLYPEFFEPITVHYDVEEDTSTRTRDTGRTDARKTTEKPAEAKPAAAEAKEADEPAPKRGPGRPRKTATKKDD